MEIWSVSGAGGQWDGMKCIRVQAGSQRAPVRLWLCNPCLPAQAPRPPGWVQSGHPAAKVPALGKSACRDEHVPKHLASAESSCGDRLMRTGCGTGQLRALSPGKTGWGMCSPCSAFESKLQAPYALAVGDLNYLQPAPPPQAAHQGLSSPAQAPCPPAALDGAISVPVATARLPALKLLRLVVIMSLGPCMLSVID